MALRIRPHARSTRWRCPRASAGRSCRCADHGVAADVAATSGAATCGDHGGFAGTAAGLTAAPAGPAAGRRLAGRENRGGAGGVPEARAVAATRAPSVLAADAAVLIRCPRHRPWPRWLLRPQLSTRPPSPRRGDFEASVLDIGQGHAALVAPGTIRCCSRPARAFSPGLILAKLLMERVAQLRSRAQAARRSLL